MGAQRLSASLTSAPCSAYANIDSEHSAQRLSASLTSAPDRWITACSAYAKCSTPFGISDFGTGKQATRFVSQYKCSTPFGISDFGTLLPQRCHRPGQVLNAFRHL